MGGFSLGRKQDIFSILLLIPVGICAFYAYQHYKPCARPIVYAVGEVDERFGVSESDVVRTIYAASKIWSDAAERPLFIYDKDAKFKINLIFDYRQETTQRQQVLTEEIDQTLDSAEGLKNSIDSLRISYDRKLAEFNFAQAEYESGKVSYNDDVEHWNDRGGAPRAAYNNLEERRVQLMRDQLEILRLQDEVNALADEINTRISHYNELAGDINENVDEINSDGLTGTTFEEGVYISDRTGKRIDIFQFDDETTFTRVVAHELGHALGIGHNDDPFSIMNPLNQERNLSLSGADLAAMRERCDIE